jgi:hypothetical protein
MTPARLDQLQVLPELTKMLIFPGVASLIVRYVQQPWGKKFIERKCH